MQFIDLKKQHERIEESVRGRINAVLGHGKFIMGPEVTELEGRLAAYVGGRHCISCSSGTDALLLGLMALGVGPGDAVFTSPFTFIATAEVISLLGGTPVFADIDIDSFNIDAGKLDESIRALKKTGLAPNGASGKLKPRGIIAVDLFGLPAEYDKINRVADEHGMFVLEDAAQSFGGRYNGSMVGNLSRIAATSFFPAKPLGCYGDGGAVFTNDDGLNEVVRSIRVHGMGPHKYDNVRVGINGRLDTIQAAVLLSKMDIYEDEMDRRQVVASRYSELLKDAVTVPRVPEGLQSAWAQYSVLSENRADCMEGLKSERIPSAIYYPKPLHLQEVFAGLGYKRGDFPVSEYASEHIFSIPMHPYLEEEDQARVAAAIKRTAGEKRRTV